MLVNSGTTHPHFIPGGRLALSPIAGLARFYQGNHAPIDLRDERYTELIVEVADPNAAVQMIDAWLAGK